MISTTNRADRVPVGAYQALGYVYLPIGLGPRRGIAVESTCRFGSDFAPAEFARYGIYNQELLPASQRYATYSVEPV